MSENKQEQIVQGFNYAKNILNSISVIGIDNCQKISAIYNNIEVFLNMLANEEIHIVVADKEKTVKQSKANKE